MRKKFTLIELIIVIVVIGILAAMALPKFNNVVRDAKTNAMINDVEVLEKTLILYYQKYDKLPLLNDDQELIVLNNEISLIKMVQAEEVVIEDMKSIYTSLQETLKHYNDSEENLYRIDIKEINDNLSKKLKYGTKKEDRDFYVYSTKTNNVYYYNIMINGEGEIQHSEFNTKLKETTLVDKKFSYNLEDNNSIINNKPIVELTTNLNNLTNNSLIEWTYSFIDEDETPTKISFILNDIEYDSFDEIPKSLKDGEYIIKLKMQDSKGLWSDEIVKNFIVEKDAIVQRNNVSLGYSQSMAINKNGKLYVWGSNHYGQLGIGNKIQQSTPQLLELPYGEKPFYTSSGGLSSMVITEKGNLYAWGYNAYDNLGIGNAIAQTTPQKVTFPNGEKPISLSIGDYHSMVITNKGNLYGWGQNCYGQLGMGNKTNQTTPKLITLPNGEKPISISLGGYHSMIITDKGNLYVCGSNSHGELGIGNTNDQITFQKVTLPNGEKPNIVTSGFYYSMVTTNNGNIYTWGENYYGQLGIGSTVNKTSPQRVSLPNNEKAIFISAGSHHAMAITNSGNLYAWGRNSTGELGIGSFINKTLPQKVTLPNGEKSISISSGSNYTIATTDKGNLYCWGENTYEQLGIGNNKSQASPVKLTLP